MKDVLKKSGVERSEQNMGAILTSYPRPLTRLRRNGLAAKKLFLIFVLVFEYEDVDAVFVIFKF